MQVLELSTVSLIVKLTMLGPTFAWVNEDLLSDELDIWQLSLLELSMSEKSIVPVPEALS